jgi:hypothetical protein
VNGDVVFLPWLRRGIAQAIDRADPLRGPIKARPAPTAWIQVEGVRVDRAVSLLGPEHVLGLGAGQVIREEPRPDSADVEDNYFVFAELSAPDLPWMLTPAAPDAQGRLRPWLVLVVVREQEGVSLVARSPTELPVLRIAEPAVPADELPDLADSWAWAHVQSLVPADQVEDAVAAGTGEVIARIVSPRRLVPRAAWRACLVPAFAGGVARGLGQEVPAGALAPAWTAPASPLELPVYHSWRFTTGRAGDFEDLCRRLQPDGDSADMGRHAMEIGDPGVLAPAKKSVRVDMQGALETPGVRSRPWDPAHRKAFERDLTKLLNAGPARAEVTPPAPGGPYDAETQDPVVAPPLYGCWPAGVTEVPREGWAHDLNLDPVQRSAAGLGAAVVRADQEALVAAAWEQAGQIGATVAALNGTRLAVEIGRSWARRASALPDADLLRLTAGMHGVLRDGATTVRARLAASAVPSGIVSYAHLRATRPSTSLARDWRARTGDAAARLGPDHVRTTLLATKAGAPPGRLAALAFAAVAVPDGAQVIDPVLEEAPPEPGSLATASPARIAEVERATRWKRPRPQAAPGRRERAVVEPGTGSPDVSDLAEAVRATIDPLPSARAGLVARIPALGGLLAEGALPTTLALGPVFEDPLSADLIALSATWLLPGVEAMARNRVRLVAENPEFIGSVMVGASHEMGRELLWRDYPVDLRATFFHRFWDYVEPPDRTDLGELADWGGQRLSWDIRRNMGAKGAVSTVIVVRGDIVRRYPSAHYFLQKGVPDGEVEVARFAGAIDRETVFFGFDRDPGEVRAEWHLAIEEQPGAPRLGLDRASADDFGGSPTEWDDLSWGHLVDSRGELDALTHAPAEHPRLGTIDGVTWGRNSAHQARASWQRPFRMLIPASTLI